MAYEGKGTDLSFTAAEDLSGMQYMFVHQASDTTIDRVDSAAEQPIGILQNAPETGEVGVVRVMGVSKLVMNDAVAVGVLVKCEYVGATDNGKGDAVDTDGDPAVALCIQASGAENDVGAVIFPYPGNHSKPA